MKKWEHVRNKKKSAAARKFTYQNATRQRVKHRPRKLMRQILIQEVIHIFSERSHLNEFRDLTMAALCISSGHQQTPSASNVETHNK